MKLTYQVTEVRSDGLTYLMDNIYTISDRSAFNHKGNVKLEGAKDNYYTPGSLLVPYIDTEVKTNSGTVLKLISVEHAPTLIKTAEHDSSSLQETVGDIYEFSHILPSGLIYRNKYTGSSTIIALKEFAKEFGLNTEYAEFDVTAEKVKVKYDLPPQTKGIDPVRNPTHYQVMPGVEAIELIRKSMSDEMWKGYCLGNTMKYRLRAGKKGDPKQDLDKADFYKELYEKYL